MKPVWISGKVTVNVVPIPSSLPTVICPLCRRTNLIHHGQSDTVALGSVGGIPLIETVKYVKTHVLAHAASIVNDLEYGIAVLLMQLYLDFSPVRGEFDGIVNQVDPDLV